MTIAAIVGSIVLLVLNGGFVAVEFALIAAQRSRIEQAAADGDKGGPAAVSAMQRLPLTLSGAQLGITMASLGLGVLAEPPVAHFFEWAFHPLGMPSGLLHSLSFAVALFIVVFLHMVVGEMVPKNIALADAEVVALRLSRLHGAFVTVFRPLIWLLNGLASLILKPFGIDQVEELGTAHTAQELVTMIDASKGEGLIDESRHDLLSGALDFRERDVSSVMIAWGDVVTAERHATVAEISALAASSGHSRIPIVLGDVVLGFVHAKDLLFVEDDRLDQPVERSLIRRMIIAPRERSLEQLLFSMQRSRVHFAVVRDGAARLGIATLEDILESIVGDIIDESDRLRGVKR